MNCFACRHIRHGKCLACGKKQTTGSEVHQDNVAATTARRSLPANCTRDLGGLRGKQIHIGEGIAMGIRSNVGVG
jgi:hypothetical protein